MNFLKTFILLLVLVLGIAYVYKTEHLAGLEKEEAEFESRKIFNFDPDEIIKIRVKGKDTVEATLENGQWEIVSPIKVHGDGYTIKNLLKAVSSQRALEVLDGEIDMAVFGLENPRWELEFYLSGNPDPQTLWIGNETVNKGGVYAKTTKLDKVFIARKNLERRAGKNLFQLRSKRLVFGELSELAKVEFSHGSMRVVLEREKDATWKMLEPMKTKADKVEADALAHAVLHALALKFVENLPDESVTGFNSPKTTAKIWEEGQEEPTVIIFGNEDRKEDGVWAKNLQTGTVVLVKTDIFQIYDLTIDSLRDKALFRLESGNLRQEVVGVHWKRNGETMEISRNKEGNWEATSPRRAELDQSKFLEFLETLKWAEAKKFANEGLLAGAMEILTLDVLLRTRTLSVSFYGITGRSELKFGSGGPFGGEPFLVDPKLYADLDKRLFDFAERHIFKIDPAEVVSIAIERGDMKVKVQKGRGEWRVSEPRDYFANDHKVSGLIGFLIGLEYERKFAGEGETADKPLATVRLKSPDKEYLFTLLRYNKDKTLLVAKLEGDDSLFLIKPELLQGVLPEKVEDLIP